MSGTSNSGDRNARNKKTREEVHDALRIIADAVEHIEESMGMMERRVEINKKEILKNLADQKKRMERLENRMEVVEEKINSFVGERVRPLNDSPAPDGSGIFHILPSRPPSDLFGRLGLAPVGDTRTSHSSPSTNSSFSRSRTTRSVGDQPPHGSSPSILSRASPSSCRTSANRTSLSDIGVLIPCAECINTNATSRLSQSNVQTLPHSSFPSHQPSTRRSLSADSSSQKAHLQETSSTRKSSHESITSSSILTGQKLSSKADSSDDGSVMFIIFAAPSENPEPNTQSFPPSPFVQENDQSYSGSINNEFFLPQQANDFSSLPSVKSSSAPSRQTSNATTQYEIFEKKTTSNPCIFSVPPNCAPTDSPRLRTGSISSTKQPASSSPDIANGSKNTLTLLSRTSPTISQPSSYQSLPSNDSNHASTSWTTPIQLSTITESVTQCVCPPRASPEANQPHTNQATPMPCSPCSDIQITLQLLKDAVQGLEINDQRICPSTLLKSLNQQSSPLTSPLQTSPVENQSNTKQVASKSCSPCSDLEAFPKFARDSPAAQDPDVQDQLNSLNLLQNHLSQQSTSLTSPLQASRDENQPPTNQLTPISLSPCPDMQATFERVRDCPVAQSPEVYFQPICPSMLLNFMNQQSSPLASPLQASRIENLPPTNQLTPMSCPPCSDIQSTLQFVRDCPATQGPEVHDQPIYPNMRRSLKNQQSTPPMNPMTSMNPSSAISTFCYASSSTVGEPLEIEKAKTLGLKTKKINVKCGVDSQSCITPESSERP